ncbi:Uncharacterized protein OS=Planctomyces maris DSM 8797 GN=PM8797T_06285 PE=4 SV=1 [Gemmata massiliana]|uniref:Glycosyltransferase RgtA/B/C/D-like domain-containing protein n=1 Tax=Gemmata massiliana TaxID=1210884 RepID=A0A6P2DAC6_9BACT|nr:hypothetical protein [Gemmata massiliana]VTR96470.1 Uncharacterized protein OS=Planctomyces maris DSM 8797 GN=PM8797T_06285 PE=4 SV=1 [Gemmata massiliana]
MTEPERPGLWRPWRSAALGWLVTAGALIGGVPIFLSMPPWCDVTLYQMAARNVLNGGVHYRDIFDTNLPGFVWAMAAAKLLFGGWNYEALRAVDLLVIGSSVALLCGWVRRCGATSCTVAWLVAAAALYYPFTPEFSHIQRDPWMLLPAALAARLRLRRVMGGVEVRPPPPSPFPSGRGELTEPNPLTPFPKKEGGTEPNTADTKQPEVVLSPSPCSGPREAPLTGPESKQGGVGEGLLRRSSILEGFLWGAAVWLKPHVVVPAFLVWVVSAVLLARRESRTRVLADLGALMAGGLLAGAPGVAWLIGTGAWPYFLDIFLNWNPAYFADSGSLNDRAGALFTCFRPWSMLHYPAIALAVLALWEGRVWSRTPGWPARLPRPRWWYAPAESERAASARLLLAAFYLGWLAQAVFLQRGFEYVHAPLLLLAFAVVASQRWCFGFVYLLWFVAVGALLNVADTDPRAAQVASTLNPDAPYIKFEKHPLADWSVMKLWPRTWREGGSPELRDRLGQYTNIHCGTQWRELNDVANYLRTVEPPIGPGELNCWNDSTHPLYLMLDVDPATRYMHYGTAFAIKENIELRPGERSKRQQIADAVANSRQRYVVSDLVRMCWDRVSPYDPSAWAPGDPLPVWLPANERQKFPWNQPVVYRSGRYVVHKIDPSIPLGTIRVPDWNSLDQLPFFGPDE